jgi:excisionase family DNA binding protein
VQSGSSLAGGHWRTDLGLEGRTRPTGPPLTQEHPNGLTASTTRRLVSIAEAAEILGVSTKSVRRYIAAGDLDAVRLGRRTIRIKAESIDRMIDAHPVNAWRVRRGD